MTEFEFIKTHLAPLAGPEGLGLLDDAAQLVPPAGHDLVLTKDTFVEGVHFPLGEYGANIAERLLRTNLSDLAAKGAAPLGYMLSLAIPPLMDEAMLAGFAKGLAAVQESFPPLKLYGGDTVRIAGPMVVTATLIGKVPSGKMVLRSGAQAGDIVWVSGHIGEGAMGLRHVLSQKIDPPPTGGALWAWEEAYLRPQPRLSLGPLLRKVASAAADVSDGLVADAGHIAAASEVGITLRLPDVPLSTDTFIWANGQQDRIKAKVDLMTAGDDYEIVFTAPPEFGELIKHAGAELGIVLTPIGDVIEMRGISVLGYGDEIIPIAAKGYQHF
jgi:thiamine-monophosphate kinase